MKELNLEKQEINNFPKFKYETLSLADFNLLEDMFKLNPDQIKEKIKNGLELIGSQDIGDPFVSSKKDWPPLEEDFNASKNFEFQSVKINVENFNTVDFALYFKREKLINDLKLIPNDSGYYFISKHNNYPSDEPIGFDEDEKNRNVKLSFTNASYPHLTSFFSISLYDSHGELIAILPIDGKYQDREVSLNNEYIKKVYFRELSQNDNQEYYQELIEQSEEQIKNINQKLNVSSDQRPRIELLLSNESRSKGEGFSYEDGDNQRHNIIYLTKLRLSQENIKGQLRLVRHEYLHNLDNTIGINGFFSDNNKVEIINIVTSILKQKMISEITEERTRYENGNEINSLLSESNFFQDSVCGHPSDNVHELFVSIMNIFTDPDFEKYLSKKRGDEQKKISEICHKIFDLVIRNQNE